MQYRSINTLEILETLPSRNLNQVVFFKPFQTSTLRIIMLIILIYLIIVCHMT
jgi:hypothetical protein